MNVNAALKETSRSVVGSRSWASKSLLAVQVAISLVLLVGAGLFLRTLTNLRHVDVGFNPQNLLLFRVNPQLNRYDEKKTAALYREHARTARQRPRRFSGRVVRSGLAHGQRQQHRHLRARPYIRRRTSATATTASTASWCRRTSSTSWVSRFWPGRGFSDRDSDTAPKVVMINQAAATKYFPNENPIGQRMGSNLEIAGQLEIVGILRDVKYNSVREAAPPTMFVPYTQTRIGNAAFEVRTRSAPAGVTGAVREAVRQIDQNLPVMDVSTQIEQVEMRFQQEKFFAQAYTLFGVVALLAGARSASSASCRTTSRAAPTRSGSGWRSARSVRTCCAW